MYWTYCLVWVALISATSPRCQNRNDSSHSHSHEERTFTDTIEGNETEDDTARHRTSERSLPFDAIDMIQELERLRKNPAENRVPRIENGTYKVINNFSAVHLATRRGLASEQPKAQDVVVFPGPTSKLFVPRIPEECLRTGICEDLPGYPEERVATIIEKLGDAKDKYKVDELDTPEIAQRIGPPEEMELCDFALKVVIPKAAPDKDGIWHYILNQKDKPLQGFHVEICRQDRSPCTKLVHFYTGYEASCKQKYVLRYMAGLNEHGEMVEKPFKLPSCCSCVVRQTD
ncbi:protein spaetzle-like [Choristoneura fumiferana]|uniref:protein spaetzle-like n=1 Tax=Choristoneura fumiferana TaxID=7141 RepID=UPI003D15C5C0